MAADDRYIFANTTVIAVISGWLVLLVITSTHHMATQAPVADHTRGPRTDQKNRNKEHEIMATMEVKVEPDDQISCSGCWWFTSQDLRDVVSMLRSRRYRRLAALRRAPPATSTSNLLPASGIWHLVAADFPSERCYYPDERGRSTAESDAVNSLKNNPLRRCQWPYQSTASATATLISCDVNVQTSP